METGVSFFTAAFTESVYPVSYGYISVGAGEAAYPADVLSVIGMCRIATVTLRFEGADAANLVASATGWTSTLDQSGETPALVLNRSFTDADTRFDLISALEAVSLTATDDAYITATLTAVGSVPTSYIETEEEVEGETVTVSTPVYPTFTATGSCVFPFGWTTWQVMEAAYPTWSAIEGKTRTQINATSKPAAQ